VIKEIEHIQGCMDRGDQTIKTCFDGHYRTFVSGISKVHIKRGMYYVQINNFLKLYSRDQVMIIENEELRKNLAQVMKLVCDHVQLNTFKYELPDTDKLSKHID
jgi:hypothetical protein